MGTDNQVILSEKDKRKIRSRMNRIEGQIRGISKMMCEDSYCDEILHQIKSVESALKGVKKSLLEAYVRGFVIFRIQQGDKEIADELLFMVSDKRL